MVSTDSGFTIAMVASTTASRPWRYGSENGGKRWLEVGDIARGDGGRVRRASRTPADALDRTQCQQLIAGRFRVLAQKKAEEAQTRATMSRRYCHSTTPRVFAAGCRARPGALPNAGRRRPSDDECRATSPPRGTPRRSAPSVCDGRRGPPASRSRCRRRTSEVPGRIRRGHPTRRAARACPPTDGQHVTRPVCWPASGSPVSSPVSRVPVFVMETPTSSRRLSDGHSRSLGPTTAMSSADVATSSRPASVPGRTAASSWSSQSSRCAATARRPSRRLRRIRFRTVRS